MVDITKHNNFSLSKPVLKWLVEHIDKNTTILEFGGGYSTLFLSKYVKKITTVEESLVIYELISNEINKQNIKNIRIVCSVNMLYDYDKYDIILVDSSRFRVYYLDYSINKFNKYLLLDDTHRVDYGKYTMYINNIYKSFNIYSLAFNRYLHKKTTIWYKNTIKQ